MARKALPQSLVFCYGNCVCETDRLMSGLVALFAPRLSKPQRETRLKLLAQQLKHRGPDRFRDWYDDKTPLSIAFHRLSLVDLSIDAAQPMTSALGRYVVAMDGEIANAGTLRAELETSGLSFRTRSDTEVLLSAIEAWGLNTACQKITGGFAIGLYDTDRKHLHLIRDRFGEKPLYIGWVGNELVCGSDLRVFRAHPDFEARIAQESLAHYLRLGFIPEPYSIFANVYRLPPGCRVLLDLDILKPGTDLRALMDPYWLPARVVEEARTRRQAVSKTALQMRVAETGRILENAVRDRAGADVPMGVLLSGSVGSAVCTALLQKHSTAPVSTFSIAFTEGQLTVSRALARHLGADHKDHLATPQDISVALAALPDLYAEPFADPAVISEFLLARYARSHMTAALTGHGACEVFGGRTYYHHLPRLISRYGFLPLAIRRALAQRVRGGEHAAAILHTRFDDTYEHLIGGDKTTLAKTTPVPDYPFRRSAFWPTSLTATEWLMMADTLHVLPNRTLMGLDRAMMAEGLQTRTPFLDPSVFLHAWSLPEVDRVPNLAGPFILRRLANTLHIPDQMLTHGRSSGLPVADWLRSSLRDWAGSILSAPVLSDRFGINPSLVRALWHAHLAGQADHAAALWRIIMLALWERKWMQGYSAETTRSKVI